MWWYSLKIKAFAPKSLLFLLREKKTGGVETEIVSFSLINDNDLRTTPYYFVYFWAAQIRTAVQMPRSQVKIPSSPPSSLSSYKLGHRPGPHLGIWTMQKIYMFCKRFIAHKWPNFHLRTHCIWSSPMSEQSTVPPRTRGTESLSKIFPSLLFTRWSTLYVCQNLDFDLHDDRQGNNRRDHRASHPERSLSHLTSKTF